MRSNAARLLNSAGISACRNSILKAHLPGSRVASRNPFPEAVHAEEDCAEDAGDGEAHEQRQQEDSGDSGSGEGKEKSRKCKLHRLV